MANWAQITMTARGTSRHGQGLGCQTCNALEMPGELVRSRGFIPKVCCPLANWDGGVLLAGDMAILRVIGESVAFATYSLRAVD